MAKIRLPNNWDPRTYQLPLWRHMEAGGKRAIAVWHRRSGKDDVALHWTACAALQRTGTYWHMLPQATQARKAVWDAVNPHTGKRRIDEAFPREIRESTREHEMMIRFKGGSTWQVVGSDNYDALMGSPPVGVTFSEYALSKPSAWAYIRPILRENDGWAMFISTPRGRNHLYDLFRYAESSDDWYTSHLPATKTDVFSPEELDAERKELCAQYGNDLGEAIFRQEYHCAWDAAIPGSIYGSVVEQAEGDGRICNVPYDPSIPVETWWDLGVGDATAIVFVQYAGQEIHIIDYLEDSGKGLEHYAKELQAKPYVYSRHIWPHDGAARELGTGRSRQEVAQGYGLSPVIAPRQDVEDGINAVRQGFARFWIHHELTDLIEALRQYRYEWDDKRHVLKNTPLHDWASHAADAVRTGMTMTKPAKLDMPPAEAAPGWMAI